MERRVFLMGVFAGALIAADHIIERGGSSSEKVFGPNVYDLMSPIEPLPSGSTEEHILIFDRIFNEYEKLDYIAPLDDSQKASDLKVAVFSVGGTENKPAVKAYALYKGIKDGADYRSIRIVEFQGKEPVDLFEMQTFGTESITIISGSFTLPPSPNTERTMYGDVNKFGSSLILDFNDFLQNHEKYLEAYDKVNKR